MLKAVIFDLDGVMVDTEMIHSDAFEMILNEHDVTPEKNEHGIVHEAGKTTPEVWKTLKAKHTIATDIEELTVVKREVVLAVIRTGLQPLPGLLQLLDNLSRHTLLLAVATSAQTDRVELILNMLTIRNYFSAIVSANDVKLGKPDPEPYRKVAEQLHVATEHCIVIEDSELGVQSACSAGMKVVAVPNEYTKRMNFDAATMIVNSLEDLDFQVLNKL
jgi:HAD superfamily hydrolase (TIGR01509 family)